MGRHVPTDLTDQIAEDAALPATHASDGTQTTAHPLPDVIEADKYLKGQAALEGANDSGGPRSGWGRLRTARAVPPGAV